MNMKIGRALALAGTALAFVAVSLLEYGHAQPPVRNAAGVSAATGVKLERPYIREQAGEGYFPLATKETAADV